MENGKYAQRIADLSRSSGLNVKVIPVNLKTLQDTLLSCPNDVAGVIVVHCETSSGKINPANEIGEIVKKCNPGDERIYSFVKRCVFKFFDFFSASVPFLSRILCISKFFKFCLILRKGSKLATSLILNETQNYLFCFCLNLCC